MSDKDKIQGVEESKAAIRKEIATLEARLAALETKTTARPLKDTSTAELLSTVEKLQERENQFFTFLENSPSAAAVKEMDGTFIIVNKIWREWFGSDEMEVIGKKAEDIFTANFAQEMADQDARVVETGESFEVEIQTPLSDGTIRTTLLQKFPIKDSEGNVVAIGGTNTDISRHKNIESELLKNELILKDAIESIPEGFALYDTDDRLAIFNQNFLKNREELRDILRVGITFAEQASLREERGVRDKLHQNVKKVPLEERIRQHLNPTGEAKEERRHDGTSVQTLEVRTPNGGIAQIRTDITRLKNTEDALNKSREELEQRVNQRTVHLEHEIAAHKKSQALMQSLIDSIPEGFVYYDENDELALVNSKYAEGRKGIEEGLTVGATFESVFRRFNSKNPNKYVFNKEEISAEERLEHHRNPRGPIEVLRPDGRVTQVNEVKIANGGTALYFTDITAFRAVDQLKSEFVSTVSHELRTPLTSIKGSLGLVMSGALGEMPEQASEMLTLATRNCDRLVGLVNDILDIEKLETGKMDFEFHPLNLGALVSEAIEGNEVYASEYSVKFSYSPPKSDIMVNGDSDRLIQVVANLLSNAAKFSPAGETIEISVMAENNNVRVSVSDRGPGISVDFYPLIFGRFTQIDSQNNRQSGGSGLGLNISKSIIEKHDGTIDFKSKVGSGSTFFFTLPVIA